MSEQLIVRLSSVLKARVQELASAEGRRVSDVVRDLLDGYVAERDVSGYIDALWERVGRKLKERGADRESIRAAIETAREDRRKP